MEAFASTIVQILLAYTPMGVDEFEDLCNFYAWPRLIAKLYQGIEQRCSTWERACKPSGWEETL